VDCFPNVWRPGGLDLWHAAAAGDLDRARLLQEMGMKLTRLVTSEGRTLYTATKAGRALMGYPGGLPRPPLDPTGPREIDQPPPLRDFAPRQPRREFRSGNGLLCPGEFGFVLPQRQHQHGEFSRGGHGRLREASPPRKTDSPTFQRREFLHPSDQGRRRLEQ